MTKILLLLLINLFLVVQVQAGNAEVAVGMKYSVLKERLESQGINVGAKNGPVIFAKGETGELRFARLDEQITLLVTFSKETQKVTTLGLHMVSSGPPSMSHGIVRSVSSVEILDSGELRVTMKRK